MLQWLCVRPRTFWPVVRSSAHWLCTIVVGGRHFWLFALAGGPPYVLYTYLIYIMYILCVYIQLHTYLVGRPQCQNLPANNYVVYMFCLGNYHIHMDIGISKRYFVPGIDHIKYSSACFCAVPFTYAELQEFLCFNRWWSRTLQTGWRLARIRATQVLLRHHVQPRIPWPVLWLSARWSLSLWLEATSCCPPHPCQQAMSSLHQKTCISTMPPAVLPFPKWTKHMFWKLWSRKYIFYIFYIFFIFFDFYFFLWYRKYFSKNIFIYFLY